MALVAACYRQAVVLVYGPAGNLLYPVCTLSERQGIRIHGTAQRGVGTDRRMAGILAEVCVVVAVLRKFRGVHNVEAPRELSDAKVGLERDSRAVAAHTGLGGDDDYAVGSPGTVDGG